MFAFSNLKNIAVAFSVRAYPQGPRPNVNLVTVGELVSIQYLEMGQFLLTLPLSIGQVFKVALRAFDCFLPFFFLNS